MKDNFNTLMGLVLQSEGGYVDDPSDPGGPTKFGITLATLGHSRGQPVAKADIAGLTQQEAFALYRQHYWDKISADALPSGVDYVVFDAAVNSGPKPAALWLQTTLKVRADGVVGPLTLAAVAAVDTPSLINFYCDKRLAFLQSLETFNRFGRGWQSRIERVRRDALALSRTGLAQQSAPPLSTEPKKEPPMDQTQSIFQSRTVWSNIIGFGAFILTLTGHGTGLDTGQLTDSIMQLVTAGSFLASTVFRILSTKKVTL